MRGNDQRCSRPHSAASRSHPKRAKTLALRLLFRLVMSKSNLMNRLGLTRRQMIGTASLATVGTAMIRAASARAQQRPYQEGKDPGKHDPLPEFKYDLESSRGWEGEGGSAKEVTVEEFPVSQSIAGVD